MTIDLPAASFPLSRYCRVLEEFQPVGGGEGGYRHLVVMPPSFMRVARYGTVRYHAANLDHGVLKYRSLSQTKHGFNVAASLSPIWLNNNPELT